LRSIQANLIQGGKIMSDNNLKIETAQEVPAQEQQECAYLDCNNKGTILDNVEIATGLTEKKLVCKEHVGQLNQHIVIGGEIGGSIYGYFQSKSIKR
jgi:hypothetical protein